MFIFNLHFQFTFRSIIFDSVILYFLVNEIVRNFT